MMTKTKKADLSTVQGALQHPSINKRIEDMLGKRAPQFCSALIQVSKQTHLTKCDPMTIIGGAMTAASMDLSIDPNLGFAHIVPYGKSAQFQMGYKGFIQLALRTGQYAAMNDFSVNKEAFVSFNPVTGDLVLESDKLDESGDIVGYGFYFRLVNGFEKTVYWPKEKIEKHAKQFSKSYAKGFGPWKDMFDAMARKTVIKLTLGKYGILSTEMQMAVTRDQAVIVDDGEQAMVYADNETSTSSPVYAEPALPAEKASAAEAEITDEAPTGDLKDVGEMNKTELNFEITSHKKAPYFDAVLETCKLGDELDWKTYPMSCKRDFVTALRETAAAGA